MWSDWDQFMPEASKLRFSVLFCTFTVYEQWAPYRLLQVRDHLDLLFPVSHLHLSIFHLISNFLSSSSLLHISTLYSTLHSLISTPSTTLRRDDTTSLHFTVSVHRQLSQLTSIIPIPSHPIPISIHHHPLIHPHPW